MAKANCITEFMAVDVIMDFGTRFRGSLVSSTAHGYYPSLIAKGTFERLTHVEDTIKTGSWKYCS
jgi:hypothetical protein